MRRLEFQFPTQASMAYAVLAHFAWIRNMERSSVCTLDEAIDYQNDDIVERFINIYDMPFEEAELLFLETKKWIWLLAIAHQERILDHNVPRLVLDNFLISIDEMWHNFILFTKLYQEYCLSKFELYIHHNPTPQRVKVAMKDESVPDNSLARILEFRKEQYSYIYDKLGAGTLELWYGEMSDKYTTQYFDKIRK